MINFQKKNNLFLLIAALALLTCYYVMLERFFPNASGKLGNDYAYFLPFLLDGFFWYNLNGFWAIPWFTPSFCGGSLNYANVQSCFYTLPQLFTFLTDPLAAARLTLILFAAFGLLGFYLVLRQAFFTSRPASFLGAGLFLFNGFYTHRMLIGHFGNHAFMLLPLICWVLLRPLPEGKKAHFRRLLFDALIGGLLFAYMVQSGFGPYLIPVIIAVVLIGLFHGILHGRQRDFWLRWAGAGIAGILLCSSKLAVIYHLMGNFPRSIYKLPGTRSVLDAAWLIAKSLFISPAFDSDRMEMLTNLQWALERHEWEYSVSIVPLLIILCGSLSIFRQIQAKPVNLKLNWKQWLQINAIAMLLIVPVAINTYSPGWNAILKQLPLIKSSSNVVRWFIIYIPTIILISTLMLEKIAVSPKSKLGIAVISMAAVVALNASTDRNFYLQRSYDPEEILKSYYQVKAGRWTPGIKAIGINVDNKGQMNVLIKRNNMLVHGASQMYCYEALFGYQLEDFPAKSLHPGPVMAEQEGLLNIKNPACYVWPEANHCKPGDHFTVAQKEAAWAFVNYRPFPFKMPASQKAANWINALALVVAMMFLLLYTVGVLYHRIMRKKYTFNTAKKCL